MMACFTLTAISDENAEVVLAMGGCSFDALGNYQERVFDCHHSTLLLVSFWQPEHCLHLDTATPQSQADHGVCQRLVRIIACLLEGVTGLLRVADASHMPLSPSMVLAPCDASLVLQISSDVRQAKCSRQAVALRRARPRSTPCSRKPFGLTHVRRYLQY